MAVPYTNTTCDIYRNGNSPPAAPDVAGVPCALVPKGRSTLTTDRMTHVLLVGPTVDVRDAYRSGSQAWMASVGDSVYVPDRNGVRYDVVLVRRVGRGTALDHKEAHLQ